MPTHYKKTRLFGGAIVAEIPAQFADVSKIRQVPDNQEVFIDKDGFTSIIVEITERVGGPGSSAEIDGKALSVHLEEIVGSEIDGVKVWNTTDTEFTLLGSKIPAYTLIATQTPKADKRGGSSSSPDFTALILTLIRLEREKTDILITVNVPHIKGSYDEDEIDLEMGKQGKLIGDAVEHAARIWSSFDILDWKLFNEV
ncbi:hypothetical protein MCOR25_004729 [Pyricularia grisea]|uniref:Uncharacterized protein n=1 Tax=Pyricularia grisea TaxID=148305 RepID=A0A6P8AVA6_PYRGI|nr:uncharacterized protein PgNI_08410 [Pyricularia grisea]KAI6368046.1 hypothetical protein MCOR25_004729 [Pyricularia grisea]TLD06094.1 hypothetical protein PgNI_08410 [Pyricularia grisea]